MRSLCSLAAGALSLTLVACGGGGARKPAEETVARMATALAKVRSYHLEGTQTEARGAGHVAGDVTAAGSMRLRIDIHEQHVQFVVLRRRVFVKGNAAFWGQQGGPGSGLTGRIANRWVRLPGGFAATTGLQRFLPANIAYCATSSHGTLTLQGTRSFQGKPVTVIADKGDHPGDAPSVLYIAATGPPLPVRHLQTGPQRQDGSDRRCGDENPTATAADIRFSDFDKPVTISTPPNVLDLGSPGGATA